MEGSSSIFSKAEVLLSNLFYLSDSDYRFYLGMRYGRSSGVTPVQEKLSLAGAGLNQTFSNDYYRSKGSLPVQWQRDGNLYLKNIAQVRGVLTERFNVFNNNLLVGSLELMFPNPVEYYNIPFVSDFNPYIFGDIGAAWNKEKPRFDNYVKSGGFGINYRTGFVLSRIFGLERIDLEFPIWLGTDLNKIKAQGRWTLFLQFDMELTPLF